MALADEPVIVLPLESVVVKVTKDVWVTCAFVDAPLDVAAALVAPLLVVAPLEVAAFEDGVTLPPDEVVAAAEDVPEGEEVVAAADEVAEVVGATEEGEVVVAAALLVVAAADDVGVREVGETEADGVVVGVVESTAEEAASAMAGTGEQRLL